MANSDSCQVDNIIAIIYYDNCISTQMLRVLTKLKTMILIKYYYEEGFR